MTRAFRKLAQSLGRTWVIALLGVTHVASQLAILVTLAPVSSEMLRLQCLGFSAERTLAIFRGWEASGAIDAYRAHFLFDDFHWLWYAGFFTALLGRLFERRAVSHRFDWILLLPLASGLLDLLENQIQHVFLGAPGFSAVVDPLPLISTGASILKWGLVLLYVGATAVLLSPVRSETASSSRRA
jgi:hypothetical protein